jgi:hypothetical protein
MMKTRKNVILKSPETIRVTDDIASAASIISAEEDVWFDRQNWGAVVLELLTNRNVKTERTSSKFHKQFVLRGTATKQWISEEDSTLDRSH